MRRMSLCVLTLGLLLLSRSAGPAADAPTGVVVDKEGKTVSIDAKIAPRKIDDPRYKEIYPIEVIACWPFDKGQKAHETVVTIDVKVKPSDVHKGLVELGLKPGAPVVGEEEPKGPEVKIFLEIPGP